VPTLGLSAEYALNDRRSTRNDFKFRQQINAAYASYQTSIGDWTWLGGLRAELTRTDAQQLTGNISNTGSYFEFYPSLHVDRSLSDESTLSFGASRRVTRPDPDNLNPYVDHEYTPNLRAGNPYLRPQYTQSYEVGYGFEGRGLSFGLTGYYRLNRVGEYVWNRTHNQFRWAALLVLGLERRRSAMPLLAAKARPNNPFG